MPPLPQRLGKGGSGGTRRAKHSSLHTVYDPLRSFAAAGGLHRYPSEMALRRGSGGSGGSRWYGAPVASEGLGCEDRSPSHER